MLAKLALFMMLVYQTRAVAVWSQCGGYAYTGSTVCDPGSACIYVNYWYYQCQPVSSTQTNVAKVWEQCGGIGYTGYTTCDVYLTCVYINPWYYQCQNLGNVPSSTSSTPATTTTTTTPTTTTTTTTPSTTTTTTSTTQSTTTTTPGSGTVQIWGQCGGTGYTGSIVCSTGLTCVYINDWYYQCQNTNSNPTTQSTTTSTSTTATTTTPQSATSPQSSTTGSPSSNKLNGCSLAYGRSFDYSANYSNFDYITIWIGTPDSNTGSTNFNQYYQGVMLTDTKNNNKMPVFYAYIVAFEARTMWGLQDCDVGSPNLCQRGAEFIRQYRSYLVGRYSYQAQNIASYIGANAKAVFLIEPDFYQYYSDSNQQNGTLSGPYMRALFDDFAAAIRTNLPNAIISWDISAWATQAQMTTWWGFFSSSSYIDYLHTSGGQSRPDLSNIKPNELTWSFMSQLTGKKIIADCGYGVGGSGANNCMGWADSTNLANRINDGVVAVSQGTLNYQPSLKPSIC